MLTETKQTVSPEYSCVIARLKMAVDFSCLQDTCVSLETFLILWASNGKSSEEFGSTPKAFKSALELSKRSKLVNFGDLWVDFGSLQWSSEDFGNLPFFKVNIGSSKSI